MLHNQNNHIKMQQCFHKIILKPSRSSDLQQTSPSAVPAFDEAVSILRGASGATELGGGGDEDGGQLLTVGCADGDGKSVLMGGAATDGGRGKSSKIST